MRKRTVIIFILLNVMFTVAALRICAVATSDLADTALSSGSVRLEIDDCRGTVYDCDGAPLTNRTFRYLAAVPPTPEGIAAVGGYTLTDAARARLASGYPAVVEVDEAFFSDAVRVFKVPTHYDDDPLCAHLIGYLDGEGAGADGIERGYNDLLTGGSLDVRFRTDARGRILAGTEAEVQTDHYQYKQGVALTIDTKVQQAAQRAAGIYLSKGAVVVLDVETGCIRAMVSTPAFSPNNLDKSLDSDAAPFVNRALTAYNVGSVYKLCVASAALEAGLSPTYTCSGAIQIGDRAFHCQNDHAHGTLDIAGALGVSCNTYFIHLGQKLGSEPIYRMSKAMGFGLQRALCRGVTAAGGSLPSLSSLKGSAAALANLSFGQGDLMATPLQVASMVQAIANNGAYCQPTLLRGLIDENGQLYEEEHPAAPSYIMSEKNAKTIQAAMIDVIESGTGAAAKPKQGGAGGKTATAETGWYVEGRAVNQAWFAGFFPAENPKYAVAVLAEDGLSGGKSAAPVFKHIADALAE